MKITHLFFALLMAFGLAFSMTACDSASSDNDGDEATEQTDGTTDEATEANDAEATEASEQGEATEVVDKSGPEYTSKYVCPMHCEGSGSAEPGKCPKCGMEYVMNEDMKADDHNHDDGHDH